MRRLPLLLPLILLVFIACPPGARADEGPSSPFEDQALLEKHLAEACDMIEAIEGHKFKTRPTVKVSTPKEVAAILTQEFEGMPESVVPADQREVLARGIARLLMAKYEPAKHCIHIIPAGVQLVAKAQPKLGALGLDHLRVLLAHEVTHALDFPRYGIVARRTNTQGADAQQALNAIVEGHAQYVAQEAAKRWNLMPVFDRLTAAIAGTGVEGGTDTEKAMRAAGLSNIRFAYVEGHTFFAAVAKAQGAAGVERAMREPPTRSRMIEEPALWLDPADAEKGPDLGAIAKSFGWLMPTKGWIRADQRVLASGLRSQGLRVPPARRAEWMQGFHDAHLFQAQNPTTGARFVTVVLHFDSPENARLFADLDRLIIENAKAQPGMTFDTKALTKKADAAETVHGFFMHRIVSYAGEAIDMRQVVAAHGVFTVEMIVINGPHIERTHLDRALTRAMAWMDDPQAAAALPALVAPVEPEKAEPKKPEPKKADPGKLEPKKPEPAGAGSGG
ncbi:MAG: zinc-dependent metalloprotease [Planctomycetota bacterium]|nr:zinc-dependent metalloprotease [Planctomycetota bacterium]